MKQMILLVVVAALLVPLAALAGTPSASSLANQTCAQLKKADGAAQFAATYGTNATKSNAFGKCVSKNTPAAKTTIANAAKACAAEKTADPAAFVKKYGSGKSTGDAALKNAMGKCVSTAVQRAQTAHAQAIANAATTCKAARNADAAAFVAKYGGKKANAYGKCVATVSKSK